MILLAFLKKKAVAAVLQLTFLKRKAKDSVKIVFGKQTINLEQNHSAMQNVNFLIRYIKGSHCIDENTIVNGSVGKYRP